MYRQKKEVVVAEEVVVVVGVVAVVILSQFFQCALPVDLAGWDIRKPLRPGTEGEQEPSKPPVSS